MFLPMLASSEPVEINGIWYNIITKDNIAEVTCNPNGDKYSGDVSILEKIVYNEKQFPVSKIGDKAFYACKSMTSINIPSSVTSIGEEAFSGCSELTSITIPRSVTSMGDFAFFGCIGLTSITIPNSLTSISRFAFCGASIPSITIPGNITSIGENAFNGCSSLTSTTILNGVKAIGREAFEACNGLTTITIPQSMVLINEDAFSWCYNLTDVYCFAEQLSTNSKDNSGLYADSEAFLGSLKQATLHVPAGFIETYQAISPWKDFKDIVAIPDGDIPTVKKCAKPEITFANGKVDFTCETEGVQFVSEVIVDDAKKYNSPSITFSQIYKVSVYATKEGYQDSDIVTREIVISNGQSMLFGDLNKDGKVNVADHVKLSEIIMNK